MVVRRFYKVATVTDNDGKYKVYLDSRELKTPLKKELIFEKKEIADAVAKEWNEQGEDINPHTMPIMSYVTTAKDSVLDKRKETCEYILSYVRSDLLCYRADISQLSRLQVENWDPILRWIEEDLSVHFSTYVGIVYHKQNSDTIKKITSLLDSYGLYELTIIYLTTMMSGSFILSYAFLKGRVDVKELFELCQLDELYQARVWGEDKEDKKRMDKLLVSFKDIYNFKNLILS